MDPTQGGLQAQNDPQQQAGDGMQIEGAPQAQPGASPQGGPAASDMQPQGQMGTFGASEQTDPDEQMENWINYAFLQANLAKKLKTKKDKNGKLLLEEIAREVVSGYDLDEESRSDWLTRNQEWTKLAMLVRENKVYPWPKASNIKYPLLATAAMQFSARAYPALVPNDGNIVRSKIVQMNPQDDQYQAAERVSQHMSFQLMHRIPNWEENMDKLLMTMAISGICFKKTYYSSVDKVNHSEIVYPEHLCVNYYATSLETAYRKTEILYYTDQDYQAMVNEDEFFLKVELSAPKQLESKEEPKKPVVSQLNQPAPGKHTPHVFLSCHTWWDLDGDGYEEPYVITIHKDTKQVVRIAARWKQEDVVRNANGKIVKITPMEYFTDFPFIPNPDGSIYALGFGLLLGPLNESSNTIINQLVDSGTINNLQSGFIGKGLRLKMGQTPLTPGEWKVVNATGEDLQKGVFPLPTKEPSGVLLNLLQQLLTAGNQLASIAEIFVGKMPGQNTPATTTQETIQQGMAVFTAIYKRVYRSLGKEFQKLFWLNKVCPDIVEEEAKIAGVQLQASDYDLPEWTIVPGADPSGDSQTVRVAKLQQVGQLLQMGTIDPMVYTRAVLDANEIPNAQSFIKQPQPQPPDPKMQTEQMKQQTMQQKAALDQQKGQADIQNKQQLSQIKLAEVQAKIKAEEQAQALEMQGRRDELRHDMIKQTMDQHQTQQQMFLEMMAAKAKTHMDLQAQHVTHQQNIQHNAEKGRQTLTLAAQKARQQKKQAVTKSRATP